VAFEGEIWLELDDGKTVHLERGDVVVPIRLERRDGAFSISLQER
jgi:hypothetical protein